MFEGASSSRKSLRLIVIAIVNNIHMIFLISCLVYVVWTLSNHGSDGYTGTGLVTDTDKYFGNNLKGYNESALSAEQKSFQRKGQTEYALPDEDRLRTAHYIPKIRNGFHSRRKNRERSTKASKRNRGPVDRKRRKKKKSRKTDFKEKKPGQGTWSEWGHCNKTCGVGQQERWRACGVNCKEIESKPCLSTTCPDSANSKWTEKWEYYEIFNKEEANLVNKDFKSKDACERWMKCSNKSIHHYLTKIATLPSCPCKYPLTVGRDKNIRDSSLEKNFVWEDASSEEEKLNIYKPGAKYCIRSKLTSNALASQQCCYDDYHRLITRGRDAGTPNLVSPQLSKELHRKVDVLPWVLCKGDWTRYNLVINPNNKRQCVENPNIAEIKHQILLAKNY